MKTLTFANGDQIPVIGLGTWSSEPDKVGAAVRVALEAGYRHIDCAAIYGNEAEVGAALKQAMRDGIIAREELWVTSKLWCSSFAEGDVLPALQKTLTDLQLDYLDLYLMHWPVALKKGVLLPKSAEEMISLEQRPLETTWKSMESLIDKGLCRHIGVSNFSIKKLTGILECARVKPEVNQIELHPYLQQPALLQFCKDHQIQVTGYSPLGSPGRPDIVRRPEHDVLMEDPVVLSIADQHNIAPSSVLLGWALQSGVVTIPKSVNAERIRQNLKAVDVVLNESDKKALQQLDKHCRYVDGHFWEMENGSYTLNNIWDE